MACVERKVEEIRNAGVHAGVTYDLAGGVNQIGISQLVYLLVEVAQRLRSRQECVPALRHGERSCVGGLTVELQAVVEHSEHAVDNADIVSGVLEDRTLLDVGLEHIHVLLRRDTILPVALESRLLQRLAERRLVVENAL